MVEKVDVLRDGTLVRHKLKGYEGKIEGTTAIKACFTKGGASLETTKETFQYRVVVNGQSMRYIAPVDDLEIVDAVVEIQDRKSTRLNSSHSQISYAVFCLKKKKKKKKK